MAAAVSHDRLQTFQRLFLGLAVFTLLGLTVTLGLTQSASAADKIRVGFAALFLASCWAVGFWRGSFSRFLLVAEVLLLGVVLVEMPDEVATLGLSYVAIQFRALYDQRRNATEATIAYIAIFLLALSLIPGDNLTKPAVLVEIVALGICGYVMHTLSEVLRHDRSRSDALRRSEDRYRGIFEHNPWPMWEVDPETLRILDVNDAAVQQFGYSRDEFRGMTLRELRSPDHRADLERMVPDLASDRRFSHVARLRRKDGMIREFEITSEIMDFDGRQARVAIGMDVTQRQAAERALRESEQRFRSVAENLREALMITDLNDQIIFANSRVRDVLGYTSDEVIGRSATRLLLPESQRNAFSDRQLHRLGGDSEMYEVEMVRKDGTRIFTEVSASPYRDASGTVIGTLGAISDVTERKRLENRLGQAIRMEAVGQLAGGVAHDFNNLLTVIKCHTELMRAELRRDDMARDSVQEIERAADRGATLTQQLLAFSRKQLLQPRRVQLSKVVANATPVLMQLLPSRVELSVTGTEATVQVYADPLQLENVLVTLVRNSCDAMPNGGRIVIDTGTFEMEEALTPGNTQEMPLGRYAVLSVSDTGVGMDEQVRGRLFEPFFTTKEPGEGTGLGLASMYGIIRQSGGFVDVDSSPDHGATFRIFLPSVSATGPALPAAVSELQTA
jgi:two-component system cell cycle sensor histidine kinase/response regulator CckA